MDFKTILEHWITWFKAHERLVLLLAAGFFGIYFYGKGLDFLVKHDKVQADIATQQAQIAAQKVSDDQQRNQQNLAQLAQLQNSFNSLSLQVAASMQQRAARTTEEKRTSDNASSAELAVIIQKRLGVGTIKVEPSSANVPDTLQYSLDAAHADADKLADLEQAQGDVKDLNTKLVACQNVTDKQADTITDLNNTIADSKTALGTEQKSHADDVKLLKAEKKKAWLNGFKWGAITGFLGSLFVHKP